MAQVLALIADLMFGSKVKSALEAAGHEVTLVSNRGAAEQQLAHAAVFVVDLTDEQIGGAELVAELGGRRALASAPATLGFYSHVDTATKERAERAGFDLVVPRSRMAREGALLVGRLASQP